MRKGNAKMGNPVYRGEERKSRYLSKKNNNQSMKERYILIQQRESEDKGAEEGKVRYWSET